MVKFCPECGKKISDELNFCPECGIHLDSIIKRNRENFDAVAYNENISEDQNARSSQNNYSIWDYLLVLFTVLIVLWFVIAFINLGLSSSTVTSNYPSASGGSSSPTGNSPVATTTLPQTEKMQKIYSLKQIVEDYHATHTYSMADLYVCGDMASDVWNMVETKGINAKIKVGDVRNDISKIQDATHAWVVAEVSPDEWIALECTGGFLVCPMSNICPVDNPRYYSGWSFESPREFKEYLETLNHPCPDGSILGSDEKCHLACGLNAYCTGNSVCINGKCVGCNSGYVMGQDYQCHKECPVGSGRYCVTGVCHSDGKCYSW